MYFMSFCLKTPDFMSKTKQIKITIMNLNIMIPDDTVRQMLSSGRRIQGTISLANAKEGNFHPHHRQDYVAPDPSRTEIMLRCGKAIVTKEKLSLHLKVNREHVEFPVWTITNDCREAKDFFEVWDD
jgi:hypothetical protein